MNPTFALFTFAAAALGLVCLASCSTNAAPAAANANGNDSSASAVNATNIQGNAGGSSPEAAHAEIYYQGHGSLRITTTEGKVIYVDPFAGGGYDKTADAIIVTHAHYDHNGLENIASKSADCVTITQDDALAGGTHNTFDLGFAKVQAVQAGFNANHNVAECVGYVITLSSGQTIYVSGDTSTTDDMRDGTLAALNIDYAFFCCDGVYNMGPAEAAECARLVRAKHNTPYHTIAAEAGIFGADQAAAFDAPNKLVLEPGQSVTL